MFKKNKVKSVSDMKVKKPFYKKTWFIVIALLVVIGSCSASDNEDEVVDETEETEVEKVEVEEVEVEVEEAEEEAEEQVEVVEEVIEEEPEEEGLNAEEYMYVDFIQEQSLEINGAFTELARLTGDDFEMTDDWIMETAMVVTTIKKTAQETIAHEDIPAMFTEVHASQVQAMKLYDESMDTFVKGIDNNFDSSLISKSTELLDEGTKYMNISTEQVLDLIEE